MITLSITLVSLLTLGTLSLSCQETWKLEAELSEADVISFRNLTKIGEFESLFWQWSSRSGAVSWISRLWRSLEEDKMFGGFTMKQGRPGKFAFLRWNSLAGKVNWISRGRVWNQTSWNISLPCYSELHWSFQPGDNGTWTFTLGNTTMKSDDKAANGTAYENTEISMAKRKRRSLELKENSGVMSSQLMDNSTVEKMGNLIERIMEIFLSQVVELLTADSTGEKESVFRRVGKWMNSMLCKLRRRSSCQSSAPQGPPSQASETEP